MRQRSTKFTFVCHIAEVYHPQVRLRAHLFSDSLHAVSLPAEPGQGGSEAM